MSNEPRTASREREMRVQNGWVMLMPVLLVFLAGMAAIPLGTNDDPPILMLLGIFLLVIAFISCFGFFTLQPNESRVLVLFGDYKGTVRTEGFHWGNPFYSNGPSSTSLTTVGKGESAVSTTNKKNPRMKVSLRSRNLNGDRLKVNDKLGNPIEIAAVVVWRVQDTAQAMFDVEDFEDYVRVQSESAVRHLGSQYAYDHGEAHETTLRSGADEVSDELRKELQKRLERAGVVVEEARLTHLAYAPEIAQAMLRRQQAEAVLAARHKIVHGAVSMVEMALRELDQKNLVDLDPERRAAMVSNLLVVLCGETEVQPVVNTGTLYG